MLFLKILFCLLAYLIGSIPFGLIIANIKKVDLRNLGSKNIGAANVGRVLGKKYGVLTFTCDMLKAALFVALFRYEIIPSEYMVISPLFYGFLAAFGHSYSIFLKFNGGKAVASGAGALFAYTPITLPIAIILFILMVKITKIAAVGSLSGALITIILLITQFIVGYDFLTKLPIDIYSLILAILLLILIIIKHIPNIKRMINKNENKI